VSARGATGSVVAERPCTFGETDLRAAAAGMVGEISQVPPMVSAVRVGGERLYKAARRGEDVERPARTVAVYALDVPSIGADKNTSGASVIFVMRGHTLATGSVTGRFGH